MSLCLSFKKRLRAGWFARAPFSVFRLSDQHTTDHDSAAKSKQRAEDGSNGPMATCQQTLIEGRVVWLPPKYNTIRTPGYAHYCWYSTRSRLYLKLATYFSSMIVGGCIETCRIHSSNNNMWTFCYAKILAYLSSKYWIANKNNWSTSASWTSVSARWQSDSGANTINTTRLPAAMKSP